MGRGEPYGKTHIGWLAVGAPASNNQRTTGSLEFLKGSVVEDLFDEMGATTGGDDSERSPIVVFDNTLDYALMNPPYSRTRGGQSAFDIAGLTDAERAACQRRWGSLIKNQPALKTAGMAASFLCLAHKKLKPGGRMGFVLPLTAAFAETWTETRAMIVKEFADVVAVSKAGTSEGKDALSADTHLGEMLLVATRKPRTPPPPPPPPRATEDATTNANSLRNAASSTRAPRGSRRIRPRHPVCVERDASRFRGTSNRCWRGGTRPNRYVPPRCGGAMEPPRRSACGFGHDGQAHRRRWCATRH